MNERNFMELLGRQWDAGRFLCIGLDPDYERIPQSVRRSDVEDVLVRFCCGIIDATHDLVCSYKPNIAFFEAHGDVGWRALRRIIDYIHQQHPYLAVIVDAKRGDIGKTNRGYVLGAFGFLCGDAITLSPYLSGEALMPFLADPDKGAIVLCKTSNPGAGEFQDLILQDGRPLYQHVADRVANAWNVCGNCAVVVGATYPQDLGEVRKIVGDLPILIPGIGTQAGDLPETVRNGRTATKRGMIINASSSVIHASSGDDYLEAAVREAQSLHEQIETYRLQEVA